MQNFLFKGLWILSRKSGTAKEVLFHPRKNLLVGRNHTGKSSLIKTLLSTLGARPTGKLEKWDPATLSLVKFSVADSEYSVIHQSGSRAAFDSGGHLIGVASSHREWSAIFAGIVGFNLIVTEKNESSSIADPRCFFLAHYINQDGSWQAKWDTFQGIQQYSNVAAAVVDYFSGVCPPEFYKLAAEKRSVSKKLDEIQKEQVFLRRARSRLEAKLPTSGPKLDSKNFEKELALLTTEVTDLNREQEELRDKIVNEREVFRGIQLQIELSSRAIASYEKDARYLQGHQESLVCPTCGAEHEEPFIDILEYAEDARVLRELVIQLHSDLSESSERVARADESLKLISANYKRVGDILATRKGELELGQVLSGMGAEEAFQAFQSEIDQFQAEQFALVNDLHKLEAGIKELTSRERTGAILKLFRESYSSALFRLNLPPKSMKGIRLTSRPDLSGSGGPRQVLAYYSALWRAALGPHGSFNLPIIIDSPNQQGQDEVNLPAILDFIAEDLPEQSQVLVGSEISSTKEFECVIALDTPYGLLKSDEFDRISAFVTPYEQQLYAEFL